MRILKKIEYNTRIAKIRIAILNAFIFIVEMQPNLSKVSANRTQYKEYPSKNKHHSNIFM